MRLSGKVALVTGAASGIGFAIAQAFAREGARVCVADVNVAGAEAAAREVRGLGVAMDVTREDQVDAGVARCARELGGVDVMVSNAGVQHISPLTEFAYADWRRVVAIHLDGGFLLTRACLREMVKQKRGGSLIYMGSVHSKEASPLKAAYVAAKHGLVGLTKVVALETANDGITCNAISPGWVLTPLVQRQIEDRAKAQGKSVEQASNELLSEKQPMLKFSTPENIGALAVFLASDAAESITGSSYSIDGGWIAQ